MKVEGEYVSTDRKPGKIRSVEGTIFKFGQRRRENATREFCAKCPLFSDCMPMADVRNSPLSMSSYYVRVEGKHAGDKGCGLVFPQGEDPQE